jgi:periplasmic protein TonB
MGLIYLMIKTETMEPLAILQADPLDILFENRNKDYGAYPLRKFYHRRLLLSLAAMLMAVVFFSAAVLWVETTNPATISIHPDGEVFLTAPPVAPAVGVKPRVPVPPHMIRAGATAHTVPLIVRSETIHTSLPEINELDTRPPGPVSQAGPATDMPAGSDADAEGKTGPANAPPAATEAAILSSAEIMPEFPGGAAALRRFLLKNLNMPPGEADPGTVIRVLVKFVVNRDGEVSGIETIQSGGKDYDSEVGRVIGKMPRWKPGLQHGIPVNVYYVLPVSFAVAD